MSCGDFSSHEIFPVVRMTPLPWKARKTKRATVAPYPKMGIAVLWLKYKLNYTQVRTFVLRSFGDSQELQLQDNYCIKCGGCQWDKKSNHYFFEYTISIFDTVLDKPFSLCYN